MKKFYTVKFVTKKGGWQDWIIHIEANTAKEAKELAKERFERIYGMHQFHIEVTRLPDTEEFLYHTFCQMSKNSIKAYEEAKEARKAAKEAKKSAKAAQEEQAAQITETAPEESAEERKADSEEEQESDIISEHREVIIEALNRYADDLERKLRHNELTYENDSKHIAEYGMDRYIKLWWTGHQEHYEADRKRMREFDTKRREKLEEIRRLIESI